MGATKAMFGAGCFWGVQVAFDRVPGVISSAVGYSGGHLENPTYHDVCSGQTGHAEVVEVTFDPEVVSYETLLATFWASHDPTQLNRQGPDVGSQYRSAVYTCDAAQAEAARASMEQAQRSGRFATPIVTEITPAATFWPAEDYHQKYLEKRGLAHCH